MAAGEPTAEASAAGARDRPAGTAAYDDSTVIVKYRHGISRREARRLLERAGVERTIERIAGVGAHLLRTDDDPAAVARRLEASTKVAYAEPNALYAAQGIPNDPRFPRLWGLHNRGQTGGRRDADIDAPQGWRAAGLNGFPNGGGAAVGLVDTGIDATHPDLLGSIRACGGARPELAGEGVQLGQCDDDSGHGTHVAGTLGATADNRIGVAGVAFNSPLIACRALGGSSETGRASDIAQCIRWAHGSGAEVITMSFAGRRSETLHRAIKNVWRGGGREGAVLVSAAGNGGGYHASYPAAFKQVVSVAATTDRDRRAPFSNRHRTVDLAAPGAGILSTWDGGGYKRLSGTSMAVPHVAGVAAQLRLLHPGWKASGIRTVLYRSVDDLGPSGRDPSFGYGRVNLAKATSR